MRRMGGNCCRPFPGRRFIHRAPGTTLADAVLVYQYSIRLGAPKTAIPEQPEDNQHFREYFGTIRERRGKKSLRPGGRNGRPGRRGRQGDDVLQWL